MSAVEQKPVVLYCYDEPEYRYSFQQMFEQDFSIIFANTDSEAERVLRERNDLDCLFFECKDGQAVNNAILFLGSSQGVNSYPIFLLAHHLDIDDISQWVKNPSIVKCYHQPYDRNVICSDVYAVKMSLRQLSQTTPPPDHRAANGVLLVDDEVMATKYLVQQLAHINKTNPIYTAGNAEEAIAVLNELSDKIAVVISDQRMPGMKGDTLLNELRKNYPQITRVLTSAYQEVDVALGAVNQGQIFRYLKKPWDLQEVNELIHQACEFHQKTSVDQQQLQRHVEKEAGEYLTLRRRQLKSVMMQMLGSVVNESFVDDYSEFLQSLTTSRVSRAAVRASKETNIENQLIDTLKQQLTSLEHKLSAIKALSRDSQSKLILQVIEKLKNKSDEASGFNHVSDDTSDDNACGDIENVADDIVQAIDVLLLSSHLDRSVFKKSNTSSEQRLENKPGSELRCHKHLLSPLTNVSQVFIKNQLALLFLFSVSRLINSLFVLSSVSHGIRITFKVSRDECGADDVSGEEDFSGGK